MDAHQDDRAAANNEGIIEEDGIVEGARTVIEEEAEQDGNDSTSGTNSTSVSHSHSTDKGSNLYVDSMFEITEENKKLKLYIEKLEKDVAKLEADTSNELYSIQLESLEKTISQQRSEIDRLQTTCRQQSEISQKDLQQLREECDSKIERVRF